MPLPIIPGLTIIGSKEIVSPNTKLALLLSAGSGMGKTCFSASLNRLTEKHEGKPTLLIPVEASEGGGAASIRALNIPMIVPKDLNDILKILGSIRNDKSFGGVILDSSTEMIKQHVKPAALRYPPKENFETRKVGVPTRSDYQVMGELASQIFRQLLLMTTHERPEYRKHVIVTATQKEIEENEKVIWRGPELPGAMAREAVAMFQISATLRVKAEVIGGKRELSRYLYTAGDGVDALKDRFEIFPPEVRICRNYTDGKDGEDLCSLWEKYWLPAIKGQGA